MNTTEKRKEVCRLLKAGELNEFGKMPKQPSKVIYNLKAEQLDIILNSHVINWDKLQDVISRIWGNNSDNDGENGASNGESEENKGESEGVSPE